MTVEGVVAERLSLDAAVSALVSTRVYLLKLPQKLTTFPAIRVQLIDEPEGYHLRGEHGIRRARVQVDAYASEAQSGNPYTSAVAVADAVDAALSGQVFQQMGSPSTIAVTGCFREDRRTMYEAEEIRLLRVMQDYYVWTKTIM